MEQAFPCVSFRLSPPDDISVFTIKIKNDDGFIGQSSQHDEATQDEEKVAGPTTRCCDPGAESSLDPTLSCYHPSRNFRLFFDFHVSK